MKKGEILYPVINEGVEAAVAWLKSHPGRDACDAATAVICNGVPGFTALERYMHLNEYWAEFLAAVKEAVK